MNKTKWYEIQKAMYALDDSSPKWRIKCIDSEHISTWDGDWFYHFSEGGFQDIEWLEIMIENDEQKHLVHSKLVEVHVPGTCTKYGFRVYGYVQEGTHVEYI